MRRLPTPPLAMSLIVACTFLASLTSAPPAARDRTLEARVSAQQVRLPVPAPARDGSCSPAAREPRLNAPPERPAVEHLLCVDTLDCGECCGSRGRLRKFWQCCNAGGGFACAAICARY